MHKLGRYAIEQKKPQVFKSAITFKASGGATVYGGSGGAASSGGTTLTVSPAAGGTIGDPKPLITVDLSSIEGIDPKSIEMRMSGFGVVPAKYDAASKKLSYQVTRKIRSRKVSVILRAKAGDRKVDERWSFTVDPAAAAKREAP
jgi:hypothetical protein